MMLTSIAQYGIKRSTEVVSHMTSVERILEYTQLPQEKPLESSITLPNNWPSEGKITFKDVSMKYSENDPLILKVNNVYNNDLYDLNLNFYTSI